MSDAAAPRPAWKRIARPAAMPFLPLAIALSRQYMRTRFTPAKRFAWSAVVQRWLATRHHRFECPTLFGSCMRGDIADMQGRYLYYFGVWEPNLTDWIGRSLAPGDVFIDVGANLGYFSLLAARRVGTSGRAIAIEASPTIHDSLVGNLELNRISNVRPVNLAVSNRVESLPIYLGPVDNNGMTTTIPYLDWLQYECTVEARPLGEICTRDELAAARLVKIDVEGAEWAVVEGMAPLLSHMRDDLEIAIEINAERLAAAGKRASDVFELFEAAGFHAYRLPVDYTAEAYFPPRRVVRPERLTERYVSGDDDYVFSRRDVAFL